MGLSRLLFWLAITLAALWLWRRLSRRTAPTQQIAAPMVRCVHCGVHVPREQALRQQDHWYCCQTHLHQGAPSREH
ncbi:MAG: PP0621 family protein [Pseudomonas sp.]|uniref:PP0621 family protein n=1 Tax=Pseudomonas sp. TaxID=306 RepID=UPI003395E4F8